ncbi:Hypothetical predicted protein [Paramuricea clavata]|nr:Hypothetical predicted protein [Paramuricea clavata]
MEPLATEDEARVYAEQVTLEEQQQQELMRRFSGEVSLDSWCKCSFCSLNHVVNMEECRCCTEMEEFMQKVSSYSPDNSEQGNCVTEHSGFDEVCLKQWVLEVAGISLKNKN